MAGVGRQDQATTGAVGPPRAEASLRLRRCFRSESGRALSAGVHQWLPRDPRVALARRRCSWLSESSTTVSAYRSVCAASAPDATSRNRRAHPRGHARCRTGSVPRCHRGTDARRAHRRATRAGAFDCGSPARSAKSATWSRTACSPTSIPRLRRRWKPRPVRRAQRTQPDPRAVPGPSAALAGRFRTRGGGIRALLRPESPRALPRTSPWPPRRS